jgi:hypothetical protein
VTEKRKRSAGLLIAAVVGLVVAAIGWWVWSTVSIPSYGGLTAEQWLPEVSGQNPQAALKAFHEMGPRALPFLVRAMGRKETKRLNWYARVYPKLPRWLRSRLRPPYSETPIAIVWHCAQMALLHDPNARSALPALARMLNDPGIWSHTYIASAIMRLAREGDTGYVRDLAKGLHDRDPQVRRYVAETLEIIGAPAKKAVPQLKAALNDPSPDTRIAIAWTLWGLAHETNACREALISAIRDGASNPVDQMAILHLREIDPQGTSLVMMLMERMNKESEGAQIWDCEVLQQIGPAAKAAVPLLTERVKNGGPALQKAAAAALNSIGPAGNKNLTGAFTPLGAGPILLDSGFPNPESRGIGRDSRQCAPDRACGGAQERCAGLPMDPAIAHLWHAPGVFSARGLLLCFAD